MDNLYTLSSIKPLLEKYNTNPQKKFGQNFLINKNVIYDIADLAGNEECGVIEIGPGIGAMTNELCKMYKKVLAIEVDNNLIPVLKETLAMHTNLDIINEDALKVNYHELLDKYFSGMDVCVCANLPYYITTPIIISLLQSGVHFKSITIMIQKEVADRLLALPGSSDYGAITLLINYYSSIEKCFNVGPSNFYPAPKVTSSVVKLNIYDKPIVDVKDEKFLFKIINAAFSCRRKSLVNSLIIGGIANREVLEIALENLGYDKMIRGEKLSIGDFAKISDYLGEKQ